MIRRTDKKTLIGTNIKSIGRKSASISFPLSRREQKEFETPRLNTHSRTPPSYVSTRLYVDYLGFNFIGFPTISRKVQKLLVFSQFMSRVMHLPQVDGWWTLVAIWHDSTFAQNNMHEQATAFIQTLFRHVLSISCYPYPRAIDRKNVVYTFSVTNAILYNLWKL